jgi:hypothetical protein
MKRKKEVIEAIMDCLRDQEIQVNNKKEALQLVPFMAVEHECLELFGKNHLEECFIEFLRNQKHND